MLKSIAICLVTVFIIALFSACKSNESSELSNNSSALQSSDTANSVSSDNQENGNETANNTTSSNKNTTSSQVSSTGTTSNDKNSNTNSSQATNSSQSSSTEQSTSDKNNAEENKSPIDGLSLSEQYSWYANLTAQEQYNFMQTFPSVPDFVNWHNKVEAAYKAEHPEIELGKDSIVGNSK